MYGSLEAADLFHAARGNPEWASSDPTRKTEALTRASDYISAVYGELEGIAPVTTFETATYIAANLELNRPGFFSVVHHPDDTRKILVGVDTIKWEVIKGSESDGLIPRSTLIDSLFARYTTVRGLAMFVV